MAHTLRRPLSSRTHTPNPLPAAFLRGGTSKGIFINRKHLPAARSDWAPIFLRIMGSPDPAHARQLDGMGGGVSSLSKIMVVGPPPSHGVDAAGVDAEYTFAQVGIRDADVDYSGNCGNLSCMAGVFAVDEGICTPHITSEGCSLGTVRLWNTNTNKEIHTTFPLSPHSRPLLDLQQSSIAGVPGTASQILLDFISPAGARTGKLLPTGNPVDALTVTLPDGTTDVTYTLSLVDATNPTLFIAADALFSSPHLPSDHLYTNAHTTLLATLERIRRAGALAMGLDPSARAQPKLAILGVPRDARDADISIHALSMGVLHRAVPITVALCLGVAAALRGTVAQRIVQQQQQARMLNARGGGGGGIAVDPARSQQGLIRISHPSGVVDVGAEYDDDGRVRSAKVVRTGRRLMHGAVWW